ncbi:MAG: 16S rRNA (guanine(966)-N(2))-methyltransferase RsmD [Nitrospirae bacterium RIFOXYB2_FULL_43_5]|nr:MAG: 16S rRNA (guanine(966)-N(2))-methyltransferase RsmD [Nitrospirae bacterium GWF2_44_13]OGW64074.1 MAG: 16S rRNA (guanine(966)-N(2))-methyltransferase RsmD [Nitrospirae bacterium RIFOXYA2_FULL_44_9]OGW74010.1 MAG: 16S rRNA (guanine(966)-N(2))-methyltransferase RsmD [Nitrospirae bacterium RIFOXYC2_FULL_44_7]OGW74026.1 MAG: 16S rRNA (guanine(966)-N(2))-methyltransferase RsmD [Nitrospirae bacterium RIFOXYB2_FULL_43_5]
MRISAGNLKGRKLSSAKALRLAKKRDELRPTSSKVKESIFNIVGEKIKGTEFVDLYSGTGAVGIEALSRGASAVSFVEADRKRAELIKEMLKDCGCFERAEIIKSKAADFIKKAAGDNSKFDIIFLDPPYHGGEFEAALSLLAEGTLLNDDGIIIAEHTSKKKLPDETGKLLKKKDYKYGDTMLTLFRKKQ